MNNKRSTAAAAPGPGRNAHHAVSRPPHSSRPPVVKGANQPPSTDQSSEEAIVMKAFSDIFGGLLAELVAADPGIKRKALERHLIQQAEEAWDQRVFGQGAFKGKKAALKVSRDLIKTAIDCHETIQKKVRARKRKG